MTKPYLFYFEAKHYHFNIDFLLNAFNSKYVKWCVNVARYLRVVKQLCSRMYASDVETN